MTDIPSGHLTTTKTRVLVSDGSCGRAAGALRVVAALRAEVSRRDLEVDVVSTGCDGRCFEAVAVTCVVPDRPAARWTRLSPESAAELCGSLDLPSSSAAVGPAAEELAFLSGQRRVLLANAATRDPVSLSEARASGTYLALEDALARSPDDVIAVVDAAGLTGMGGAFFPTARKWRACAEHPAPRYLVVNAEEGEPGVFKDRHLMEDDPHRLIEGTMIVAYALGAARVYVYVNGQASVSAQRVEQALEEARHHSLVGDNVLGTTFSCDLEIRHGAGGYVLGEESVILESIEGRRPMPRFRPPHTAEQGLWGHPTVIENVETLSRVPGIVRGSFGSPATVPPSDIAHTKLVCVTGDVLRPGLVEVPFGTTIRQVVEGMAGGSPRGEPLKAVLTGGPSGKLVPPGLFDLPLQPGRTDVLLGSGNLIALDARRSLIDVLRHLARFNAHESCGKCTPCREGAHRLAELLDAAEDTGSLEMLSAELVDLGEVVQATSLCGLGRMAPNPILSALERFPAARMFEAERS